MNFKINKKSFLFSILLVPLFSICKEEKNGNHNIAANIVANNFIEKDSIIIKNGYQLTLRNSDPKLKKEFKNNIAERFFATYPKMAEHFNSKATKNVIIIFSNADTDHPAHAINNEITLFTKFFAEPVRDKDIDVVVHEGFHLIQAYPESKNTPGWLVEGIADYVREVYGLSNAESGWSLPGILDDKGNKYQASYRTTARFLLWLDKNLKKGIVEILDDKCRTGTYTSEVWKKETNKTIDELWDDYVENYNSYPNN